MHHAQYLYDALTEVQRILSDGDYRPAAACEAFGYALGVVEMHEHLAAQPDGDLDAALHHALRQVCRLLYVGNYDSDAARRAAGYACAAQTVSAAQPRSAEAPPRLLAS